MSDGSGRIKSLTIHQRKVERGVRYVRLPEIPEAHWELMCKCWKQSPDDRPTFAQLLEYFHSDHNYILPGADRDSVLAYESCVYSNFGPRKESLPLD
jgi:hypothetical protein